MRSGIKIALPAEITTGRCFLQYYIDAILALQSACDMGPDQALPLIIMTSAGIFYSELLIGLFRSFLGLFCHGPRPGAAAHYHDVRRYAIDRPL